MKRLLLLSAGLLLVACSKEEAPPEPVRPVLSVEVKALNQEAVSYTHLTLPTICSV